MGMHKGMCGRTESSGPASVETLGTYLEKKYPEEMKKKLTFDEWWNKFTEYDPHMHDDFMLYSDYKECWLVAQQNV